MIPLRTSSFGFAPGLSERRLEREDFGACLDRRASGLLELAGSIGIQVLTQSSNRRPEMKDLTIGGIDGPLKPHFTVAANLLDFAAERANRLLEFASFPCDQTQGF
jgi:hypothetical protein